MTVVPITRAERHAEHVGIHFNQEEHRYTDSDGVMIPNVTLILKDLGFVDYSFVDDWYRDRGKAAHDAIHYMIEDDLNWSTVSPQIKGYVHAASNALLKYDAEVVEVERVVYSPTHRFAGKFDVKVWLRRERIFEMWDWKTATQNVPANALQLAAYDDAEYEWLSQIGETDKRNTRLAVFQLAQDGSSKRIPFDGMDHVADRFVWRGAVSAWHWQTRHRQIPHRHAA